MKVRARWFDVDAGRVVEQVVDTTSLDAAAELIRQRGAVVLGLQPIEEALRSPWRKPWGRGPSFDAAWWCAEVRVLVVAGMTVVEAIETMIAQSTDEAAREVNLGLHARLQQGLSLSDAMSQLGIFPAVLLAGVTASERSGAVVEALDEFLRFHHLIDKLRRQLVSAAIYPLMVLLIGAAIGLFLLLFVMPRFSAIYADMQQPSGLLTAGILALSRFLATQTTLVVAGLAAVAAAGFWFCWSGALARVTASLAEFVPFVRVRADEFRRAKLFQAMALMFRGGFTLDEAMQRCLQMGLGSRMTQAVDLARRRILAGASPAEALDGAGLLDEVSLRLMRVGERAGHFDRVLATIAERHAQRFGTTIERVTRVAEPLMLLLVALAVGTLVVLMYLPVFDIAGSIR